MYLYMKYALPHLYKQFSQLENEDIKEAEYEVIDYNEIEKR